jgi:REP element-mobilizing transposase RayT
MKKEQTKEQAPNQNSKDRKSIKQKGGIYFHAGIVIGKKNVFVTDSYLNILTNALKTVEVKKDIKNLAYVVMPNYFYWMFQLSPKNDDPIKILGELKGEVAQEVMKSLQNERKEDKAEPLIDLFKNNERVKRSSPEKIIWAFQEHAKEFKDNKQYKVWRPKTGITLIENDKMIAQKLEIMKKSPVSDRWQLVESADAYPYFYLCEDLQNQGSLPSELPVISQEALVTA